MVKQILVNLSKHLLLVLLVGTIATVANGQYPEGGDLLGSGLAQGYAAGGLPGPYQQYPGAGGAAFSQSQTIDLLIINLGSYSSAERDDSQTKLLELGKQLLSQGDQAGYSVLLTKLQRSAQVGDADTRSRAGAIMAELESFKSAGANQAAPGPSGTSQPSIGPGVTQLIPGEAVLAQPILGRPAIQEYPDELTDDEWLKLNRENPAAAHGYYKFKGMANWQKKPDFEEAVKAFEESEQMAPQTAAQPPVQAAEESLKKLEQMFGTEGARTVREDPSLTLLDDFGPYMVPNLGGLTLPCIDDIFNQLFPEVRPRRLNVPAQYASNPYFTLSWIYAHRADIYWVDLWAFVNANRNVKLYSTGETVYDLFKDDPVYANADANYKLLMKLWVATMYPSGASPPPR